MRLLPIENVDDFQRDEETGAILSVDQPGLKAYKREKMYRTQVTEDIANLKEDCRDIKTLLGSLLCEIRKNK